MRWELYPRVFEHKRARAWLEMEELLGHRPKTVEAYGRCLNDYLLFCEHRGIDPEAAGREHVALYVGDLASRPNPRGEGLLDVSSGVGLSNNTVQQRLTTARLFYDHLVEEGLRDLNPVGRGKYTPGNAFAGKRERGLVGRYRRIPWIPSDEQWLALLRAFGQESLRDRLMLLLSYDGALRCGELVALEVGDIDFPHRQARVRDEAAKGGSGRVVGFSAATAKLLVAYQRRRRELSRETGPLFLSESRRNRGEPLTTSTWNKVVRRVANSVGLRQFTPHVCRHLRLTHMARAGLEIHEIAAYAGHRSLRSTMIYLHMSGAELAEKVLRTMAEFDATAAEELG